MTRMARAGRALMIAGAALITCSMLWSGGVAWLLRSTAPAPRPHAVLRLSVGGTDIGADAWPARPGAAGYVEVWIAPYDADDYRPLIQVFGAPPIPVQPVPGDAPDPMLPPAHPVPDEWVRV